MVGDALNDEGTEKGEQAHKMLEFPDLLTIADEWQFASQEEESKRAYFFLHLLGDHCLTRLQDFIAVAQHIHIMSTPDVLRALKYFVCVSSYLAVLESSDGQPYSWLVDWLLQVLAQSDLILPEPPARELIESFSSYGSAEISEMATDKISSMLSLNRALDRSALAAIFVEDRQYRNELLVMSLTQSMEDLHNHVTLFA